MRWFKCLCVTYNGVDVLLRVLQDDRPREMPQLLHPHPVRHRIQATRGFWPQTLACRYPCVRMIINATCYMYVRQCFLRHAAELELAWTAI